jgi:hypothetical protein
VIVELVINTMEPFSHSFYSINHLITPITMQGLTGQNNAGHTGGTGQQDALG